MNKTQSSSESLKQARKLNGRNGRMSDNLLFPRRPIANAISSIVLGGVAMNAFALPSNPEVAAGSATVTNPNATTMLVNQTSNKVVLNYEQFGIEANELVNFVQPGADSVALNRVVGGNPTLILGAVVSERAGVHSQ